MTISCLPPRFMTPWFSRDYNWFHLSLVSRWLQTSCKTPNIPPWLQNVCNTAGFPHDFVVFSWLPCFHNDSNLFSRHSGIPHDSYVFSWLPCFHNDSNLFSRHSGIPHDSYGFSWLPGFTITSMWFQDFTVFPLTPACFHDSLVSQWLQRDLKTLRYLPWLLQRVFMNFKIPPWWL